MIRLRFALFGIALLNTSVAMSQIPTGRWYLEKFEVSTLQANSQESFGLELLMKSEIGKAYYEFGADSVTHYFSLRGLQKVKVFWVDDNQYCVGDDQDGSKNTSIIEWTSRDKLVLIFSNSAQQYHLCRKF